jgi:hypothetical protein
MNEFSLAQVHHHPTHTFQCTTHSLEREESKFLLQIAEQTWRKCLPVNMLAVKAYFWLPDLHFSKENGTKYQKKDSAYHNQMHKRGKTGPCKRRGQMN